ncbi:MAG TPA: AAA family ATPase [Solirubrobacteraceae bacterium]|jgi:hypothetical protein|nr:AAA family ATPase [Solirubrobacteraceae bacterium]
MAEKIKFDVSGVQKKPFPMHDPSIGGMRPATAKRTRKPVELPPEQEPYRLYTVDELGQWEPVTWLIEKHLAVGELSVLYGKGGTYKSFLALDWACRLANDGHTIVYIVAEGASGMRARIEAWKQANGVGDLPGLFLMPSNVALHGEKYVVAWIEAMRTQLGKVTPSLVIVDTLARNFVGGNEKDPQDMGQFVDGCERIRIELETAVLVLHHTTKDGDTERGTESLRNASFAMFKLTDTGGSGRGVKVTCDRMKDAEQPEPTTLHPQLVSLSDLGEGVSSLVVGWSSFPPSSPPTAKNSNEASYEASAVQRKHLHALKEGSKEGSPGISPASAAKALHVTRNNLSRTVKPLVELGFVEVTGVTTSRLYSVTARGLEALR